ncbi:MAG: SIR2 family protein [Phycisphaerae bacterium]|nr:SIR2 family protein [Phycisphaerae bacterium]
MDAQVARLFRKARSGKAVLFLGAGASLGAGIPAGKSLAHLVKKEFKVSKDTDDFIEACTCVLDTPGIDRTEVEDFIRAQLDKQPTEAHKKLPLNRWQAIFTTNFDDLVETAYRNCNGRQQRCEAVFSADFSRRQSDYVELVRLFKLMGCVNGQTEDSRMALTRSDYNRKLRRRGGLFRLVYDFVKDGTIIYAGYSFCDLIARDILDEVADEVGSDRLPWGWALMPEWDADLEQVLRQRKVLPYASTFEDFLDAMLAIPRESVAAPPHRSITITVIGTPIEIGELDYKMYSREFQVLHDEIGLDSVPNSITARRDYLEGKIDPWIGITREWAFVRPVCDEIQRLVRQCLDTGNEAEVPIVVIRGPAGAGKSTVARIAAYDIYRASGIPTILLHPENDQVDYVVIDSFSRQVEEGLAAAGKARGRQPTLIVVDEAAAHVQDVRRLPQYLASRGIPAVVLAVARENEWVLAQGEQRISAKAEINVRDDLDSAAGEQVALVRHLRQLEVLVSSHSDAAWQARIDRDYENSFATTLYQLAEPTRPPLNKAIRDEYEKLSPLAKQAYRYICVFYQYNIPLDLELLARSLGCSYDRFMESVYDPATRGVAVEEVSGAGDVRFRARSRLVAERVVSHVYGGTADWLADVSAVIKACLPHNSNEVKTVRNMLIHRLGPRGAEPQDLTLVTPTFQAALEAGIRDSAILHHFALLLADQEQFGDAEYYAIESLAVIDDDRARTHFRTESRQNLNNTLGMILAKQALKEESSGADERASALFTRAVAYFHAARSGEFANAYPYYSEAWMLYQRARTSTGPAAVMHIARAFQVLDEADGNVADDDIASIKEMEAKLVRFLSEFGNLKQVIEEMQLREAPTVAYLEARYAGAEHDDVYSKDHAYRIVKESLEMAPDHVPCLRLAAHLHHGLYPENFTGWKALLERLYVLEHPRRQCSTLFNLGYAECQLGQYDEAIRYFEELEQESTGHPRRSRVVEFVRDGQERRKLSGRVVSVQSWTEGWVKSEVIASDVKFIPRAQRFSVQKGQAVTFVLALNYRGCLAVELRPE